MVDAMREISGCEVCGGTHMKSVLDLGPQPMCDDLVSIGESRTCVEYPIEILYCSQCQTAHQRYQIPKQTLFPQTYHYRARFTADVLEGMSHLVAACESRFGTLVGSTVLDVGCNDGSLLDYFRAKGATTIGIEPTGASRDAQQKGHSIVNRFLDEETARIVRSMTGAPDIITFTNVFAHIENLPDVLASLRLLLTPQTVIVVENHYLGSVLDGHQFDTFYHEHPRTYSFGSFERIAHALGLNILDVEFPGRYGGNIRIYMGPPRRIRTAPAADVAALRDREQGFLLELQQMQGHVARWRDVMQQVLVDAVAKHGPLRAKAFPGRAAILVKLLGLDRSIVSATYEKPGSLKIGHYVPGSRIPIYSDDKLKPLAEESGAILNLAWHIPVEIRRYLTELGYRGEIIDIMGPKYFEA